MYFCNAIAKRSTNYSTAGRQDRGWHTHARIQLLARSSEAVDEYWRWRRRCRRPRSVVTTAITTTIASCCTSTNLGTTTTSAFDTAAAAAVVVVNEPMLRQHTHHVVERQPLVYEQRLANLNE